MFLAIHFAACIMLSLFSLAVLTPAISPPKPLALKLHHTINLQNLSDAAYSSYLKSKIDGDQLRMNMIIATVRNKVSAIEQKKLPVPLWSPFHYGEYVVKASIGSQRSEQYFFVDSGSDLTWLQCKPCSHCYPQPSQLYDREESTASKIVQLNDTVCRKVNSSASENAVGKCRYKLTYGDQAQTEGVLTRDEITWFDKAGDELFTQKILIGCTDNNNDVMINSNTSGGMLTLSTSPLSVISALNVKKFSYCLVNHNDRKSQSKLILNDTDPATDDTVYIHMPRLTIPSLTMLYVSVTGISVAGKRVQIPEGTFSINPWTGEGGVMVDTGTTRTYLTLDAYTPVKNAFGQATILTGRSRVEDQGVYKYCFDGSSGSSYPYPNMTFHFSGEKSMPVNRDTYIQTVGGADCFSIMPQDKNVKISLIGSVQQQQTQFFVDLSKHYISLTPNRC